MKCFTDSSTWSVDFVRCFSEECADGMLSVLNLGKRFLTSGNNKMAAAAWENLVTGLELLACVDQKTFQPYLFVHYYSLAQIYAFGLKDTKKALPLLKMACTCAKACHPPALADYEIMHSLLEAFQSGLPAGQIADMAHLQFPQDLLYT